MRYFQILHHTFQLLLFFEVTRAERILFFIGLGSHSHRVAMQPLAIKMADLGHEVTFLSPQKAEIPDPRVTELNLTRPYELLVEKSAVLVNSGVGKRLHLKYYDYVLTNTFWWDAVLLQSEIFLKEESFLNFVNNSSFDVIVADIMIKEVAHVVAYKWDAKIVWFNTAGSLFMVDAEMLGLPIESSWLPDFTAGSPYTFISDSMFYTLNSISWYLSYQWYFLPRINQFIEESFGNDVSNLDDLIQNVDLVLLNERFPYAYPRSLPPFVLPVGGMHVTNLTKALPKHLEDFVKPAEKLVFVSFGSAVDVAKLPKELKNQLFDALSSFKDVRFLWRWNGAFPDNVPANVLLNKWFPQQDILAHPNCKGFVTHGGAMSFQQSIFNGVPMIVVPVVWDQLRMARSAVEHGVGIHMELSEINMDSFQLALHQILHNPSYAQKAKIVSRRAKEEPMPAVDLAAWWMEYILRHDTAHLKSPSMNQHWWERRLLDVWYITFTFLSICMFLCFQTVKLCFNRCISNTPRTKNQVKNKQM